MTHKLKKQKGFNLIEVMVTLVIFSIGLLGLAGLQQVGLRQNGVAMQRSIAMTLAYDLLDRMRNNNQVDYTSVGFGSLNPNCVTTPCNSVQLANYDMAEWQLSVVNSLPSATGFFTGGPNGYTIAIGWDQSGQGVFPTSCSPPTPAGVGCVSIEGRP